MLFRLQAAVTVIAAAILLVTAQSALAEVFVGADLGIVKTRHQAFPEGHIGTLSGKLGFNLTEYTTLDFRLATNLSGDRLTSENGTTAEQRLKSMRGAYLNFGFGGEVNRFYGTLGYTWLTLSTNAAGYHADSSGSDLSWGGGIEHKLGGGRSGTSILFEYMNYYEDGNTSVDGASIGVKFLLF